MPEFESPDQKNESKEETESESSESKISRFIDEELERLDREELEKEAKSEERRKVFRSEGSAIIQRSASEVARETLASQLDNALLMADAPEASRSILMDGTIEKIRSTLMTPEDIAKAQDDERIATLLGRIESSVMTEAKSAMVSALTEKMDEATSPEEISKFHKLIEAIENGD